MTGRRLITFDWALKRLLRSKANFDVLEGFLSELLETDIQIVEILESESNREEALDKYNRVDMKVRNSQNELILIELQYERQHDYLQRLLFGIAKTITEHVDGGAAYSKVPKVISIRILHFDIGQGEDYIYHGTTTFKGMHTHDELLLSAAQKQMFRQQTVREIFPEIYLIRVNRFDEVARNSLDEWVYFLKTGEIREEFSARGIKKAKEVLDLLQLPEAERRAYERYQEDLHFQASMVESTWGAGMLEGERKGRREGRREGATDLLTRQLQCRFGPLPDWASARIAGADSSCLERWSLAILSAASLEALLADQNQGQ